MCQNYVEILGKPCKWEPTPELRWSINESKKVLQQLWRANYNKPLFPFFPLPRFCTYREEWRNVPESFT